MLSPSDTAIVFLLALLLFGPEQLPKLARQLGEAMRHIQSTTHTFMQEMERAAESAEPREPSSTDSIPFEASPIAESISLPEGTLWPDHPEQVVQPSEAAVESIEGQSG